MLLLTILLLPLLAWALPDTLSTVTVAVWPLSSPSPVPWLDISYALPALTTQITTTRPLPDSPDLYTRVGFLSKDKWTGIAIPSARLASANNITVELQLSHAGELYHLGVQAEAPLLPAKKGTEHPAGTLKASVKTDGQGPRPLLNKPIVVNEKGQVEQAADEKTFLQKYWWAIGLFIVMQLFVSGGDK